MALKELDLHSNEFRGMPPAVVEEARDLAIRGGGLALNGRHSLAVIYPEEVLYLGWLTQIDMGPQEPDIIHTLGGGYRFRGRRAPPPRFGFTVEFTDMSVPQNAFKMVERVMNVVNGNTPGYASDYKGQLIGFMDLANGDQLRFIFEGFWVSETSDVHLDSFHGKVGKMELAGYPDRYTTSVRYVGGQEAIEFKTKLVEHNPQIKMLRG